MKKRWMLLITVAVAVFVYSGIANADLYTLYLNGTSPNTANGAYISPYYGGINNPSGDSPIYCIDPSNNSYVGTSWNISITPLTSANLSNTYLGSTEGTAAAQTQYEEIAYLFFYTGYTGKTSTDQAAIQEAVWYIFNPNSSYASGGNNSWLAQAKANYLNYNYSNIEILSPSPIALDGNQEFMAQVPLPSAMLLLGSGLIGLVGYGRKKFFIK